MRWRGARVRRGRLLGLLLLAGRCGILRTFWVPPRLDECGCVGAKSPRGALRPCRRQVLRTFGRSCEILAGTGYQRMWRGTTWDPWLDCTVPGSHVGGTFVGTDGLLWRTEGAGRMDEVEHVYISVHLRDLLRSD